MKRRKFLQASAAAAVAGPALAAPAIAQATPEISWRLTSSFHKSHDVLFGTAQTICRFVAEATDGKFRIQPFAAGELVPGTQALDAVTSNAVSVDCAHTPLDIYFAKDPALAFGTGIPFGLNGRHHWAWWAFGGGAEIVNAALKKLNAYGFAAGLTGPQMGAWMRKEISSVEDLKGMKFRINGMGGMIIERVGAVSLQMPMSDVVVALEQGLIDAAEHACPYDDERLGLPKVAKYNYYPGWWKSAGMIHLVVNLEKWNALPKAYQASLAPGLRLRQRLDARQIRHAQPRRVAALGRRRHGTTPLSAHGAGGLPQGDERVPRRARRQECALQEGARFTQRLPQRAAALVAGRGAGLR